jgi:tRNA(Ile)-lysidine synthase
MLGRVALVTAATDPAVSTAERSTVGRLPTGPTAAVAAVRCAVREALAGLGAHSLVLVACSGGADSVALAAAAAFEAPRLGVRVGGVTVDHGLQKGSASRAATVAALLTGFGLDPVEVVAVDVSGLPGGPEAAARAARYGALDEVADRLGAAAVLVGHTLDDQAETVLLGLARGSGTRSLAGMAAVSGSPVGNSPVGNSPVGPAADASYRRPLLAVERAVTRAACADLGLPVWEDPQNADPSFARVRVRAEVLPVLEAALGPGVAAALARTAELSRDDADALDQWAAGSYAEMADVDGSLDVGALASLPPAVRRRVLRLASLRAGVTAGGLAAVHLLAIEALVTDWHGQGAVSLPGGQSASRRYGKLYVGTDLH